MNSKARKATQDYHKQYYVAHKLFQKGSWLEEPKPVIIDLTNNYLVGKKHTKILDLGSGVGRNAIPIAQLIKPFKGKVICIDYLKIAIQKLAQYAHKYNVSEQIEVYVSPIEEYQISENEFDFIIAHSVLDHVATLKQMLRVIHEMKAGTKVGGINYIFVNTDVTETDAKTGKSLPADTEVKLNSETTKQLLYDLYRAWKIFILESEKYNERYEKNGREINWEVTGVLLAAQK